jgi:plasmid stabilization system protein ParE
LGGYEKRDGPVVKIILSKTARLDLKDIIDYIKRDSVKYARLERIKIEGTINRLILHPLIGRVVPELEDPNYKELIFQNYRIIYKIASSEKIYILSIHHHSRLIASNPAFGPAE